MRETTLFLSYKPQQNDPKARQLTRKVCFVRFWIIFTSIIVLMAVPIFTIVNSGKSIKQLCGQRPYTTNWYIAATIGESFCVLVLVIALSDLLYNGELGNNYDKDAKRIKCFVILFCSTFSIRAISNIMGIHNNFPFAPSFKNPWFVVLWSL